MEPGPHGARPPLAEKNRHDFRGIRRDGAGAHFHGSSLFGVARERVREMFDWTARPRLKMVLRQPYHCLNAWFAEVGILRFVESPPPSALLEIN